MFCSVHVVIIVKICKSAEKESYTWAGNCSEIIDC